MVLQTITPEHRDLSQISIYVSDYVASVVVNADVKKTIGEALFGQWLDLDRLLVQLWESRSIRPKVIREAVVEGGLWSMKDCIGSLLPEMTKRGMIDLIRSQYPFHCGFPRLESNLDFRGEEL